MSIQHPRFRMFWFYSSDTDTTKSVVSGRPCYLLASGRGEAVHGPRHYGHPEPRVSLGISKTHGHRDAWKSGQSWSDPAIGRVKIEVAGELYERWVAFIGGGFDTVDKGREFFVVDLKTGNIIKEFSA